MQAGLTWEDKGFDTIGVDPHCLPLDVAPAETVARRRTKIFHAQIKFWEEKDVCPTGCSEEEPHILFKYGGITWFDPDHNKFYTVTPTRCHFRKCKMQISMNCLEFWISKVMKSQMMIKGKSGKQGFVMYLLMILESITKIDLWKELGSL